MMIYTIYFPQSAIGIQKAKLMHPDTINKYRGFICTTPVGLLCPFNSATGFPVSISHAQILPSCDPDSMNLPSGVKEASRSNPNLFSKPAAPPGPLLIPVSTCFNRQSMLSNTYIRSCRVVISISVPLLLNFMLVHCSLGAKICLSP